MADKNTKKKQEGQNSTIAKNRQATFEYSVEERFEAGLVLEGWEVKSLRDGRVQLKESYVDIKKGEAKDNKGLVTFKAFYSQEGEVCVMNEISRFRKNNGHWFYLDGVIKSMGKVDVQSNQGKNALCSCSSGKKFKRCCGA